mgnify:CR=1 FL=1
MKAFSEPRSRRQIGWLAMACLWLAGLALAAHGPAIGDELVHWGQILRFLQGDFRIYEEYLTNIPGYHWLLTAVLWPFGAQSLAAARLVTALFTAASVVLVHRIRRRLHREDAQRTAALFLLLPTMYLYGFLAYTDLPALALLLGALLASIHERHGLSALLLVASMAMRQNNVLWVVFLGVYSAWPLLCEGVLTLRARSLPTRAWWQALMQRIWPYLLAVACFCVYWAGNGSIAYSTAQSAYSHPDFRPDIGNPIFLLVVMALLFPFQMLAGWKAALASGRLLPVLALATFVLLAGFFLFRVEHPSNLFSGNARNQMLLAVAAGGWPRWVFSLLAAFAAGGLALLPHLGARARLWLPFSILFVAASWMIETRYTIVPITLFLLFRRPQPAWQERVMLAVWAVLALGLAGSVFDGKLLV